MIMLTGSGPKSSLLTHSQVHRSSLTCVGHLTWVQSQADSQTALLCLKSLSWVTWLWLGLAYEWLMLGFITLRVLWWRLKWGALSHAWCEQMRHESSVLWPACLKCPEMLSLMTCWILLKFLCICRPIYFSLQTCVQNIMLELLKLLLKVFTISLFLHPTLSFASRCDTGIFATLFTSDAGSQAIIRHFSGWDNFDTQKLCFLKDPWFWQPFQTIPVFKNVVELGIFCIKGNNWGKVITTLTSYFVSSISFNIVNTFAIC